jgi:hypothetical protein
MDPTFGQFNPFDFGDPSQGMPQQPDQSTMYPGMPPAPMPPLPEQVAGFLGNQNVTPQAFLQNPLAFLPKSGGTPGLGDSLNPATPPAGGGVPLPTPRPQGANDPNAMAQAPDKAAGFLKALQGVKAPPAPTPQKVSTPSAPLGHATSAIKGGNLIALLTALGGQVPTTRVPLSLGPALGGR